MKTTMMRLREALEEHFGPARLDVTGDDQDLFWGVPSNAPRDQLGSDLDRVEMLMCVEAEFDIEIEDDDIVEAPTLNKLVAAIRSAKPARE